MVQRHLSRKPNDAHPARKWRAEFFPRHSPRLKTRNYSPVNEKERERARGRAFSPGGWWALKNGNPIVSTAHRRSFTADTRKPTLNPKPGVPSFSLYESTPSSIFFQILLSVFPKNTMKRDESPPPNSKIFHVRPAAPPPKKKPPSHILYRGSTQRGI